MQQRNWWKKVDPLVLYFRSDYNYIKTCKEHIPDELLIQCFEKSLRSYKYHVNSWQRCPQSDTSRTPSANKDVSLDSSSEAANRRLQGCSPLRVNVQLLKDQRVMYELKKKDEHRGTFYTWIISSNCFAFPRAERTKTRGRWNLQTGFKAAKTINLCAVFEKEEWVLKPQRHMKSFPKSRAGLMLKGALGGRPVVRKIEDDQRINRPAFVGSGCNWTMPKSIVSCLGLYDQNTLNLITFRRNSCTLRIYDVASNQSIVIWRTTIPDSSSGEGALECLFDEQSLGALRVRSLVVNGVKSAKTQSLVRSIVRYLGSIQSSTASRV